MTVTVKWDEDPEKTGLPDPGEDSKTYVEGDEGEHSVTVTVEGGDAQTQTVTFTVPLTNGGDATLTAEPAEIDSTGDESARTITVGGTGFPADTAGTVELVAGAPGTEGESVATVEATTDADGAFTDAALIVPEGQEAGDYHLVGSFADTTSDNTAITVTSGGGETGTITAAPTEVDASGDETARTVTVSGTGFPADTAGRLSINTGSPGAGGSEIVGVNVTTDAQGAFPDTPVIVPEGQSDGDYHLIATFGTSVSDETAITIASGAGEPAITADKTDVDSSGDEAARTVTVSGTGFDPDVAGTVDLIPGAPGTAGEPVATVEVTADADGAFADAALIVPEGQADGEYHIVATLGEDIVDNTALAVAAGGGGEATLSAEPAEVDGTGDETARTTSVTGTGWTPDATVTVSLNSGAPGSGGEEVISGTGTADAEGALPAVSLIVPEGQAAGEYHITGADGTLTSDDTPFTVTAGGGGEAAITAEPVTVSGAAAEGERTTMVDGTGWTPDTEVTLSINTGAPESGGTEIVTGTATADAEGAFVDTPLIVPEGQAAGDYHVMATDGTLTSDNTAFTVTA